MIDVLSFMYVSYVTRQAWLHTLKIKIRRIIRIILSLVKLHCTVELFLLFSGLNIFSVDLSIVNTLIRGHKDSDLSERERKRGRERESKS